MTKSPSQKSPRRSTGNHGRYLRIDLTTQSATVCSISNSALRDFLGGTGLGVYLMLVENQPSIDPLSADACLAFVFSPLVGSPLTTSAKFAVVSKSPLTNRYNDSIASSTFAIAGKQTGFDALVITGRASEPSVLIVDDDRIDVVPAGDLWGATTFDTQSRLADRLEAGFQAAIIGPAGENLVRYATISHDGRHAGRGGSGAVMGAKLLKAVAVRGQQSCTWADPVMLSKYAKDLSRRSMGPATEKYRELGTASNLLVFNRLKILPTRNFQRGSFAGAEKLAPETLVQTHSKARASCAACTIGCEHLYEIDSSSAAGESQQVRVEYENLFALGPLCDIDDPEVVLKASRRCDELGMDTISAGGTIALAMECSERGWLKDDWLRFGDGEALLRALELIAGREGIGDRLADGSRQFARMVGAKAEGLAAHVKGLEMPGYEPRGTQTLALGLAVGARGADHNRSGAYQADFSDRVDRRRADERSVTAAIETENHAALFDSLILCKFLRGVFADTYCEAARMLQMICGWNVSADELTVTSQRIVAAKKLFNILAGWQPDEDDLPERFFTVPLADDPTAKLDADQFRNLICRYNLGRRWTVEGWIPQNERQRLGLTNWFPTESLEPRTTHHPPPLIKANDG